MGDSNFIANTISEIPSLIYSSEKHIEEAIEENDEMRKEEAIDRLFRIDDLLCQAIDEAEDKENKEKLSAIHDYLADTYRRIKERLDDDHSEKSGKFTTARKLSEEYVSSEAGYVYVLINPSLENMVKIGKTTKDPQTRAEELSSATGVPTKFIVAYKEYFSDCAAAEKYVHTILAEKGYRIAENREFFDVPLDEVVKVISQLPREVLNHTQSVTDTADERINNKSDAQELIEDILNEAEKYNFGYGDEFKDEAKAFELYKKAAKLGSVEAYTQLAIFYRFGIEGVVKEDINLALKYYQEAISKGQWECYSDIAEIYEENNNVENTEKAIAKFINAALNNIFDKTLYAEEDFDNEQMNTITSFLYSVKTFKRYEKIKISRIKTKITDQNLEEVKYIMTKYMKHWSGADYRELKKLYKFFLKIV